jgi:inhibitor of cysteine peptidase
MELSDADVPGEHDLSVGEELVVRLQENPTTGFRWRLAELPDAVTVAEDGFEAQAPERHGHGGVHTFRLRPTAPGEYRVAAALGRSWGSAAPERTVEFTVRVS